MVWRNELASRLTHCCRRHSITVWRHGVWVYTSRGDLRDLQPAMKLTSRLHHAKKTFQYCCICHPHHDRHNYRCTFWPKTDFRCCSEVPGLANNRMSWRPAYIWPCQSHRHSSKWSYSCGSVERLRYKKNDYARSSVEQILDDWIRRSCIHCIAIPRVASRKHATRVAADPMSSDFRIRQSWRTAKAAIHGIVCIYILSYVGFQWIWGHLRIKDR